MSDASTDGLEAILLQRQGDGHSKPVAYASCSLTATEMIFLNRV